MPRSRNVPTIFATLDLGVQATHMLPEISYVIKVASGTRTSIRRRGQGPVLTSYFALSAAISTELTMMTIDEALRMSARVIDERMELNIVAMRDDGVLDDESEQDFRKQCEALKMEELAKLRAWLVRGGEDGTVN